MSSNGDDKVAGSQSSHLRIALTKSVKHSEMIEKRDGPGVPPNISRRHKRRIRTSLWMNQVSDLAAAFSSTCALLYALSKSALLMRILIFGYCKRNHRI